MTVPGIGPIISSATVATIGSGDMFAKGRDFGAWLGMAPKQISTGGRPILGKISKRGNKYLRTLFVQAARVVLVKRVSWERYGLKAWIEAAAKRLHHNKLAIALANNSPASPGRCSVMAATSRSAQAMTIRPSMHNSGAMPRLIKAKPRRAALKRAGLDNAAPRRPQMSAWPGRERLFPAEQGNIMKAPSCPNAPFPPRSARV